MRLPALVVGLMITSCDSAPVAGDAGVGRCEPCTHTGQCASPLRCRGFICSDEVVPCEGVPGSEGGGGESGGGPAAPGGVDCEGLCAAAADCQGLRPRGELGADRGACEGACGAGSPSDDPWVLTCLIRRVDQGLCDDDSFRECLPPWAPHLAGGDQGCTAVECRCDEFCAEALACGMFDGTQMDIDDDGCRSLCHSGELERPGSLQCAQAELDAGRCETTSAMGCFGLDDGGPPDGAQ